MPFLTVALAALSLAAGVSAQSPTSITAAPSATITAAPAPAVVPGTSPLPLTQYTYAYDNQPYKVNPFPVLRGPQSGYNQCNSTTEGPGALCQSTILNSVADFCLWGSPGLSANGSIGDVEAAVVSFCTRQGHGGRVMPAGTISGVQFVRTSAYIQVVGTFNQSGINLSPTDTGGELDPHGADLLGNPLGGLMYSTGLTGGNNSTYQQVHSWNMFVGSGIFCFKACFDSITSPNYCQNVYDLIGCSYNAPSTAYQTPGKFESCDGDLQDVVGTYTSAGKTLTWSQPEVLPPNSVLPWTPRIPASSNCVSYQSKDIFPVSLLGYQSPAAAPTTAAVAGATGAGARSGSGTAATASRTSGAAAASTGTTTSSATTVKAGLTLVGAAAVVVAML